MRRESSKEQRGQPRCSTMQNYNEVLAKMLELVEEFERNGGELALSWHISPDCCYVAREHFEIGRGEYHRRSPANNETLSSLCLSDGKMR